jgi:hypothetical protein
MCRHPSTAFWKARSAAPKPEQKGVIIPPASATRRASSSRDLSPAQPAPKLMPEQQEARQHEQRPSACKPGEPRTSRRRSGWNDQGPRSTMSRTPVAMLVLVHGADDVPLFARARQNVTTVATIHPAIPEPTNPETWWIHRNLYGLLECAVVQQAPVGDTHRGRAVGM